MAKKKKRTQLSSEGKTELAKAIAEKSQTFAKTYEMCIRDRWNVGHGDESSFQGI